MSHPHNPRSFGNAAGVPTTHLPHGRSRSQGGSITESNQQRHPSGNNATPHQPVPLLPPRSSSGQPNHMPPGVPFPNNHPGYPNIGHSQFSYNNSSNNQHFNQQNLPTGYPQLPGQVPQSIQPMVSPQSHAQNFNSYQRASLYLPNNGSNHNTSSIPHHSGGGGPQGQNFSKHSSMAEQQSSSTANFPQEFVPPSVSRPSISHQHWSSQGGPAAINSGRHLRGSSSSQHQQQHHHQNHHHLQHQQFQHQHQLNQSGHPSSQQQHHSSQGQPTNSTSPADDYYPSRQRNRNSSGQLNSAEKLPPRRPAPSLPGAPFVPPTHLPIHHQPSSPQTIALPIEDHDKLINENKILQSENSQMRQLLDSKQSDDNKMQLMRKEITNLRQEKLNLKAELNVANVDRTKFAKTIESQNEELNQIKQQHAKMQEFCEQLSPTLDEDKRKIEELQLLNHNLKHDIESLEKENRDLREEETIKNAQLDKLKYDCAAHERRIALYEERCKCGVAALNESDLTQSRLDKLGVGGGLMGGHPLRPQQQQPGAFGPGGANMGGFLSPLGAQHRHANSSAGNSDKSGSSGGAGDLLGPVTSTTTTTTTANTHLSSSHHLLGTTDHHPRQHKNHVSSHHHEDQTESEELLHSESLDPEAFQRLKQQRSSIAHPPRRTQNLAAELDPLVALANQKSASAEDLTLEKRNKKNNLQYPNGQSHGKLYQKNKSTSQSLTKMSMQNKFYSQRYHGGSKYSQSQHSSSKSSLGMTSSGLYEEVPGESAEMKAELQALYATNPNDWNMHMVELFFKHQLKMSDSQSQQAAQKIKSGRSLLDLNGSTVKKFLGIEDEYQIRRLLVHIQIICNDPMMPQDIASYPGLRRMDHLWVANTFLPHLGLQNLSEHFKTNLVDMVLLKTLNEKELTNLCAKAVPNPKTAAKCINYGLRMLKELEFRQQDFKRRRIVPQQKLMHLANERKSKLTSAGSSSDPDQHNVIRMERENVGDLLVWSNEAFMNWAKALDFDDQTVGKLKLSGINGSFVAYSKFSAKDLAAVMEMSNTDPENPTFKHLKDNYDNLVEKPRKQIEDAKKQKKKKSVKQQSATISSAEGQRILQEQQQQASFKRSLSNSLSKATRLIRRSSSRGASRGSSRASSREGSQDRRSVASTGAMNRDSFASSSTGASHPFSVSVTTDFRALSMPYTSSPKPDH